VGRELPDLARGKGRAVNGQAVIAAREPDLIAAASKVMELLRKLLGFVPGTAMSSAVLTAIRPANLAVYDRNANKGLKDIDLDLAVDEPNYYAEYIRRIEPCRSETRSVRGHQWSAHEVDLPLYMLGKMPSIAKPDLLDAS
jgi:hypothetical protein